MNGRQRRKECPELSGTRDLERRGQVRQWRPLLPLIHREKLGWLSPLASFLHFGVHLSAPDWLIDLGGEAEHRPEIPSDNFGAETASGCLSFRRRRTGLLAMFPRGSAAILDSANIVSRTVTTSHDTIPILPRPQIWHNQANTSSQSLIRRFHRQKTLGVAHLWRGGSYVISLPSSSPSCCVPARDSRARGKHGIAEPAVCPASALFRREYGPGVCAASSGWESITSLPRRAGPRNRAVVERSYQRADLPHPTKLLRRHGPALMIIKRMIISPASPDVCLHRLAPLYLHTAMPNLSRVSIISISDPTTVRLTTGSAKWATE
ncbi:hypothetical protein BDP81DRAFT_468190 [Colletotrichum phormii]|uniref:Uncharacterized protein n=1 Tax=Colletotrichum phormii TaxID=359342 RepID=A0AAJ0A1L4_9PEZI|nr:uncharacterized protein BDP81DRAFT_468190 [Colletotrichum phormii]KAK1654792.1 hypothetical protein BDP81DRAFT_468190 [Colletotrichum phormii]